MCLGAYLDAVWVWPVCGGPGNLRLHRPDPKRAADKQDKRMVVILNADAYGAWLDAPADRSAEFLKPYPAERLLAVGEPKMHRQN